MMHNQPLNPPALSALRVATHNVGHALKRKLPALLSLYSSLALDAIGLQEVGDPALLRTSLDDYDLVVAPGPSEHDAGVGLLLAHSLAPRCRSYLRSPGGRLCGAVLELSQGRRMLLACAYMPTGLDGAHAQSPSVALAQALYAELFLWATGMTHVVLLGDLNETLSSLDRYAAAGAARRADPARSRTLSCLQQAGYTDVYRHMHPLTPGYTHEIDSALRTTRSRIDYIWTHGLDAHAHSRVRIDTRLHHLSHHHVLWAQLHVRDAVQPHTPRMRLRIPNMRAATASHEQAFVRSLERRLLAQQYAFPSHA